ncbi:MAG: octaprenyl diphosphate synthase [Gammaproteobacteria bacterium]|nr:octaprenyl diphosphate synthase [Gammaproteobacteria bacterium]
MTLDDIRSLIGDDLDTLDREIREQLASDVVLINQLGHYIINSGGKRLRPMLVLLAARACGYSGTHHVGLAAVVEFIHTATLLHDDVVDASDMRRGMESANAVWGNEASVLVGDFLYSRAFQMMVRAEDMAIQRVFAEATNRIAEGEVLQLLNVNDPDTDEKRYFDVIDRKTAKLFEAACEIGGLLAGSDEKTLAALRDYGRAIGTAFQLIDDVLDYSADETELGKNLGDDLAEGKPTLPLIRVMEKGSDAERDLVRDAIEHGGLDRIDDVMAAINNTGALDYTRQRAEAEAEKARKLLAALPANDFTRALEAVAGLTVHRGN